jgi:hypothetical protein
MQFRTAIISVATLFMINGAVGVAVDLDNRDVDFDARDVELNSRGEIQFDTRAAMIATDACKRIWTYKI